MIAHAARLCEQCEKPLPRGRMLYCCRDCSAAGRQVDDIPLAEIERRCEEIRGSRTSLLPAGAERVRHVQTHRCTGCRNLLTIPVCVTCDPEAFYRYVEAQP